MPKKKLVKKSKKVQKLSPEQQKRMDKINNLFQLPNINSPIDIRQLKAMLIVQLYTGILANTKTAYTAGVPDIAPLIAAEASIKELSECILDNCMLESFKGEGV